MACIQNPDSIRPYGSRQEKRVDVFFIPKSSRRLPCLIYPLLAGLLLGAGCLCFGAESAPTPESITGKAITHYQRGYVLAAKKNYPAAAAELQRAITLRPDFGAAYFWLGVCDSQQNLIPPAIEAFRKALGHTHNSKMLSMIHYDLGVQYLKQGRKPLADQEYQAAIQLNPEYARHPMVKHAPPLSLAPNPAGSASGPAGKALAHFQQGNLWAKQGNYPKACPEYDTAVQLNPALAQAHFARGMCLNWQGKQTEAIRAFQTAIAAGLEPRQVAYAHAAIGTDYLATRQNAMAISELQAAADLYASLDPSREGECLRLLKQARMGIRLTGLFHWLNVIVPLAVLVVIVFMFKGRRGKTVPRGGPMETSPVSTAGRAHRSPWRLEPELLSPTLPRRLKSRSLYQTHLWLFMPAFVCLFSFFVAHGPAYLRRLYILQHGLPGTAAVQRVYQVATGKNGRDRQTHFVLAYQPQPNRLETGDVRVGVSETQQAGQTLPIHYLSDRPGWVALDDDQGQASLDRRFFKIMLGGAVLFLGLCAYWERKRRYLLSWGKAVAATIIRVDKPYRNSQTASISFELNGQQRELLAEIDLDMNRQAGEILTAFVDNRYPKDAVIYADAPYRVVP